MDKTVAIFEYLRTCPLLTNLWSIASPAEIGARVVIPFGASAKYQYQEFFDNLGNYCCEKVPYPSLYEEYQINCYDFYDTNDNSSPNVNINALNFEDIRKVCDWIEEQDERANYPDIGENIVSIECQPILPRVRYVDSQERIIGYYITIRIRYVNWKEQKSIEYQGRN